MRQGKIILIEGNTAKVVFDDIGIQKTVRILKGVNADVGETGIVIFESGTMLNGVLIGVI